MNEVVKDMYWPGAIFGSLMLAALAVTAVFGLKEQRSRSRFLRRMAERNELTAIEQSFFFYGATKGAAELWLEFGEVLDSLLPAWLPSGKLRPTDLVNIELAELIGSEHLGDEPETNQLFLRLRRTRHWGELDFNANYPTIDDLFKVGFKHDLDENALNVNALSFQTFRLHGDTGGYVSTSATVGGGATIKKGACVLDNASIGSDSVVGEMSAIYDRAILDESVVVGSQNRIFGEAHLHSFAHTDSRVVLGGYAELGAHRVAQTGTIARDTSFVRRVMRGRLSRYGDRVEVD